MNLYPEYKDYNKVTVNFLGYTVSNINTKGPLPDRNIDGVQLQSLTIKGTSLDNPTEIGSTGTLTLIDYKHKLFNVLSENLDKVITDPSGAGADLFPSIVVEICCYSGKTTYSGHLIRWSVSFTGGVSTINVEWSVVAPNTTAPVPVNGNFSSPESLIEAGQKASSGNNLKFVYVENGTQYEGSDVSGHIKFGSNYYYDPTKIPTSGNSLVDVYRATATNSVTANGDPLYYTVEGDKFYTYSANPKNSSKTSTDQNKTCDGLVFVQNGKWPAYHKRSDGKVVIPLTNLSADIDSSKLVLMGNMRGNFNGAQVVYNNQTVTQTGADTTQLAAANGADASSADNDPMSLKIECYNIMSFAVNDNQKPISIEVYDECGTLVPTLSVSTMARSVEYDMSGAVIKASVECTNLFNLNETNAVYTDASTQSGDSSSDYTQGDNMTNSSSSSSSSSQSSTTSSNTTNMNYKQYLCSEDSKVTSLFKDRTEQLLNSGEFDIAVDEFLKLYGSATGSSRYLDYSFVNNLIATGNYGLLTLLIAVANYGIKDPSPSWTFDAVNLDPGYKNKRPFCASSIGKAPFDYTKGGLGIAHWDSGNYDEIYSTIGFDPSEVATEAQRDHFKSLLVRDNSISGWKDITYRGIPRKAPIFSKKHPEMRLFDKGLKQDSAWLSWAKKVVYYRDSDGHFIYQYYLFRLWLQKFWFPTVNNLRKKQSTANHAIGLQDAARIARAGNSATGLISTSCGKSVARQYEIYYNDKERYMRQKAFCRRCADIIGYCN